MKSDAPTSKVKVNNSPATTASSPPSSTVAPWPSLLNRRPPTPGSSKSVSLSHENVIFLSAASTAVTRTIRNAKSNGFRVSRDDLSFQQSYYCFPECEFLEYTEQATTTSSSASIESVFPSLLVLLLRSLVVIPDDGCAAATNGLSPLDSNKVTKVQRDDGDGHKVNDKHELTTFTLLVGNNEERICPPL